jgi:hypothetical protein
LAPRAGSPSAAWGAQMFGLAQWEDPSATRPTFGPVSGR